MLKPKICIWSDKDGMCIPDNKVCDKPEECENFGRPLSTEDYAEKEDDK